MNSLYSSEFLCLSQNAIRANVSSPDGSLSSWCVQAQQGQWLSPHICRKKTSHFKLITIALEQMAIRARAWTGSGLGSVSSSKARVRIKSSEDLCTQSFLKAWQKLMVMGSGCCTAGRVVASDARDLQFESYHGQIFHDNKSVICIKAIKIKKK